MAPEPVVPAGTVTLLFSDIEGSTRLLEAAGAGYGDLLLAHRALLRQVWADHGGQVVDMEGDGFFVVFRSAEQALAAADDAQRRLRSHHWPGGLDVRVRMGVHTGTPQLRDGLYWGTDVHYAARLAAAGHGGQVLVSAATQALVPGAPVERLGDHGLKDFPSPRPIFHLVVDGVGAGAFPPPRTVDRRRSNLPVPATDLIGREQELNLLLTLCQRDNHLVTIAGPGGMGKTRLMVELGHRLVDLFDPVSFVPLETVNSPGDVLPAVAMALGLPGVEGVGWLDRILDHLASRRALILLDNAEHVVGAAPEMAAMAMAGPGVRVVVTTQVPLHVAGETVVRLGSLRTPDRVPAGADLAALAEVPAVALLVERARAGGSSFELTGRNAADVVRLCEQLEGTPLALELAAARLDVMDVAALCRRLERGLDALGRGGRDLPERQRGLAAVLEWTCGLLDAGERLLVGRLSVFSGGFTADLAEAAFGDAVDELAALVDVGLVRRVDDGRLGLRPPVRTYAAETLITAGQLTDAHRAVARALTRMAEPFERQWMAVAGEGRVALNPERANIVAALNWTSGHDPVLHADLAAATGWWMTHSGLGLFGREHVTRALARTDDVRTRARLLQALGALGLFDADPAPSLRAAEAWSELGDIEGEVMSLVYASNLYIHRGDPEAALPPAERAMALVVPGSPLDLQSRMGYAQVLRALGRVAEARSIFDHLVPAIAEGSWQDFQLSTFRADVALSDGRPADALALYGRAMAALADFDSVNAELIQAVTVARALADLGRTADAALAVGVCDLVHRELSWPPRGELGEELERARAGLDPGALAEGARRAAELGVDGGLQRVMEMALGR